MSEVIEIWKDIPGYEGRYLASNLGRIKRLERQVKQLNKYHTWSTRTIKEKIISCTENANGYLQTALTDDDGKGHFVRVHNLVAAAFLGFDLTAAYDRHTVDALIVTHLNGDYTDNRVENLKIVTRREIQLVNRGNEVFLNHPGEEWVHLEEPHTEGFEISSLGRIRRMTTQLGRDTSKKYIVFRHMGKSKCYKVSDLMEKYFGKK